MKSNRYKFCSFSLATKKTHIPMRTGLKAYSLKSYAGCSSDPAVLLCYLRKKIVLLFYNEDHECFSLIHFEYWFFDSLNTKFLDKYVSYLNYEFLKVLKNSALQKRVRLCNLRWFIRVREEDFTIAQFYFFKWNFLITKKLML